MCRSRWRLCQRSGILTSFEDQQLDESDESAVRFYINRVDSYEYQIMKSIGKPCEGKLQALFDE